MERACNGNLVSPHSRVFIDWTRLWNESRRVPEEVKIELRETIKRGGDPMCKYVYHNTVEDLHFLHTHPRCLGAS